MTAIDQSNANQNKHDNQPVKFDMIYFTLASEGLVLLFMMQDPILLASTLDESPRGRR